VRESVKPYCRGPPRYTPTRRSDLKFPWRELRKQPGLALTAVHSLTLGIGATSAVFSVIYALLVNPYPYLGANRTVELNVVNERGDNRWVGVTGPQIKLLKQAKCVEDAAATWGTWNLTATVGGLPEDVPSVQLSGNAGARSRPMDSVPERTLLRPPRGRALHRLLAPLRWH